MPTKVHLVQSMVFPVVMYGCESCMDLAHKESWVPKNWCFLTVVLEKTLESPLDCKEIKLVNPKGNHPKYSMEGIMLKLQYFGHMMRRTDSLEKTLMLGKIEGRRRRKGTTEDEMVGCHHWFHGHEFEHAPGVGDALGSLVCCSPWADWTELSDWTELHTIWSVILVTKIPS